MIIRIPNELFKSNTYLVCNDSDNKCVIIDPGLNEEVIEQKIIDLKLEPVAILATHGHVDHIGGVSYFKEKYGIQFYLHEADLKLMKTANFFLKLSKINKFIKIPTPDVLIINKYFNINILPFSFEIYNLPGHTNGSCIIKYKNNIFTGDTIFKEGLYINKLPGENIESLKRSITEIFKIFNPNSICFPGHGSDAILDFIRLENHDLIRFLNN